MLIPLSIFLYLYIGLVVVFLFFAFFNIYHAIRFSFWDFATFFITFLFIAATIIIMFVSFDYIRQVNWKEGFEFNPPGISGFNIGSEEQAINEINETF
ncbi:MAG: hypothetical protein WC310_01990 [Patescibacteria group bacterium]